SVWALRAGVIAKNQALGFPFLIPARSAQANLSSVFSRFCPLNPSARFSLPHFGAKRPSQSVFCLLQILSSGPLVL
ncbi:MAG: hypothetical protein LBD06_07740, partial [Candidatus Accumulibacter sp.]|nr:hypothetical protein [Accumulibacter sp.]